MECRLSASCRRPQRRASPSRRSRLGQFDPSPRLYEPEAAPATARSARNSRAAPATARSARNGAPLRAVGVALVNLILHLGSTSRRQRPQRREAPATARSARNGAKRPQRREAPATARSTRNSRAAPATRAQRPQLARSARNSRAARQRLRRPSLSSAVERGPGDTTGNGRLPGRRLWSRVLYRSPHWRRAGGGA